MILERTKTNRRFFAVFVDATLEANRAKNRRGSSSFVVKGLRHEVLVKLYTQSEAYEEHVDRVAWRGVVLGICQRIHWTSPIDDRAQKAALCLMRDGALALTEKSYDLPVPMRRFRHAQWRYDDWRDGAEDGGFRVWKDKADPGFRRVQLQWSMVDPRRINRIPF